MSVADDVYFDLKHNTKDFFFTLHQRQHENIMCAKPRALELSVVDEKYRHSPC